MRLIFAFVVATTIIFQPDASAALAGGCESPLLSRTRDHSGQIWSSDGLAKTPSYPYWWLSTDFKKSPSLIKALERGRAVTSSEKYLKSSIPAKLQIIGQFVLSRIAPDETVAENPPIRFDDVLEMRKGSCQHLAMFFAAVSSEAGLPVKMVIRKPESEIGHAWIEVSGYVVDLSSGLIYVKKIGDVIRRAQRRPKSFEAQFYAHPNREYVDIL